LQKLEKRTADSETGTRDKDFERIQNDLIMVEAALYVAGHPLDLNELCSVLNSRSKNRARKAATILMHEYTARKTALEVLQLKDERYVLQLKADFTPHVKKFVNRPLLSVGPLKTLSYIAFRQPVPQKRVVDVRGHHAYGHVKVLKDMGLIVGQRTGRSILLKTTEYFADYFGLSQDSATMKRELKHVFEDFSNPESPQKEKG
jgi:segregation and condensation protein B